MVQTTRTTSKYTGQRSGGTADFFSPLSPWRNISIDLIDFTNKPVTVKSITYRYIFVLVDNFSRYMYARAMKDKTAEVTAQIFESILKEIKKDFKNPEIKACISDDGFRI